MIGRGLGGGIFFADFCRDGQGDLSLEGGESASERLTRAAFIDEDDKASSIC